VGKRGEVATGSRNLRGKPSSEPAKISASTDARKEGRGERVVKKDRGEQKRGETKKQGGGRKNASTIVLSGQKSKSKTP